MTYTSQYGYSRLPPVPEIELVVGNPGGSPRPEILSVMVDSGADRTVLPLKVIKSMDLPFWDEGEVRDFSGNARKVSFYTAKITIPTLEEHLIKIIALDGVHPLVGRDILNFYKVTLDGRQKKIEIE